MASSFYYRVHRLALLSLLLWGGLDCPLAGAQPGPSPDTLLVQEGLAVRGVAEYDRSAVYVDTLMHQWATGRLAAPSPGDPVGLSSGARWTRLTANGNGYFEGPSLRGGYLYVSVEADSAQRALLQASGHSQALVNGVPRMGDVYDYGWLRQPVRLQEGTNHLYFRSERGRVRVRLLRSPAPVSIAPEDLTLPDLRVGVAGPTWGGVRVTNATTTPDTALALRVQVGDGEPKTTLLPRLPAQMTRKVNIRIPSTRPDTTGPVPLTMTLVRRGRSPRAIDTLRTTIDVVEASETHKRTFRSDVDGSVQYYSVVPPAGTTRAERPPAMVLSLHGASVEATSQAGTYAPKPNTYIVAPTNRRPYGFDWEDWGRQNALKTLHVAEERYGTDPTRTYLTGHSMGGHGTWHVGVTHPHRFAAIAPFASYPNLRAYDRPGEQITGSTVVEKQIERASNPSDTYALARNLRQFGVYVVHGANDEVVPTAHGRAMAKTLADFHMDFAYYEVQGAGHWWGRESLDFPPVFDYFGWHSIAPPPQQDTLRFTTANPGISARSHWAGIEAQHHPLAYSTITLAQDTASGTITGTTDNVRRLSLELGLLNMPDTVRIGLDGDTVRVAGATASADRLFLTNAGGRWEPTAAPPPDQKGPHRYGPFKSAFRHDMLFVYGTQGTPAENRWAARKARLDAETFWYRGNGSVDLRPDTSFAPAAHPDRGVILYGHAEMNAAWPALLGDSPVQVERGQLTIGDRVANGEDLGTYFVRPRPRSDRASVGVVAGTGLPGLRSAAATRYFRAAAGFPDLLVFDTDMLLQGQDGVRYWGYFGPGWSVDEGEILGPSVLHPASTD